MLAKRHATLVVDLTTVCRDLSEAHKWADLAPLAAKLTDLRALNSAVARYTTCCVNSTSIVSPVVDSFAADQSLYRSARYASNGVSITSVQELHCAQTGLRAASVRLMLRGEFCTSDGTGVTHSYRCLIKCASQAADVSPPMISVHRLRTEHAMYQEVQRLATTVGTGCVRCYSIDPAGLYMVLEDHGNDLRALLNADLKSPQMVMEGIVPAVHALHSMNIMHGDIKPENLLVQLTLQGHYIVKLCDLECAKKVGEECEAETLGTKHYLAPEVRAAAASATGNLRASTAVDMFALGLVLWQVMKRSPTAALDCGSDARLDQLYSDQAQLNAHLEYPVLYRDFMERVTCLDLNHRVKSVAELWRHIKELTLSNAHQGLVRGREEIAFQKHAVNGNLVSLQHQLERLLFDQEALGRHISTVLADNTALNNMVQTLISGTHTIPTLAIVLPEVSHSWESVTQPTRLLRNHFRLYFLCSHTKQIAPCGPEGKGYKIEVTKLWVQDAAPVLRVGLVLVKVALLASGLPLPVPDLCSALADATKHCKYLDTALQLVTHPPDDDLKSAEHVMKSALETAEAYDVNNLVTEHSVANEGCKLQLEERYRKAYETIREVLVAQGHNIALTCGLRQVTCSRTGRTAWVLDNDATERAWRGDALLTTVAPDDVDGESSAGHTAPVASAGCSCSVS
jgi:hypothetical protein